MIRKAIKRDINEIMEIWLNTNISAHSFILKDYWIGNYESVKEAILAADVLVYEEGDIKGFIGLVEDYIAGIFVKEDMQSHGIGAKLLNTCKEQHSTLSLNVYANNFKAVEFYLRNSFEIAEEKQDLETNQLEYLMTWNKF